MHPPARAYVEAMVMMIAADGKFRPEEKQFLRAALFSHPSTSSLSVVEIDGHLDAAHKALAEEGAPARALAIAAEVTGQEQRLALMQAVVAACLADGEVADEEMDVLEQMRAAFGIDDASFEAIVQALVKPT